MGAGRSPLARHRSPRTAVASWRIGSGAQRSNVARGGERVGPAVRVRGRMLAPASAPLHDGLRDYGADPDDHAWEIARNPAWPISPEGHVTFSAS